MKNIVILLITICFYACGERKEIKTTDKIRPIKVNPLGKKYFNYDSIIYYHINFHDSSLFELDLKRSKFDYTKRDIIIGNIPKSLSDLYFLNKLEQMGFVRKNINASLFPSIDSQFCKKLDTFKYENICPRIYRDIIIFKKAKKLIGVAKICFSCRAYHIVGTNLNSGNFEQIVNYGKLNEILNIEN